MTLWVLQTLKIFPRGLSERRVVSDRLLDRGVDPIGLPVVVLVCVCVGVIWRWWPALLQHGVHHADCLTGLSVSSQHSHTTWPSQVWSIPISVTSQANSRVKSYLKKPEENSIECPYLSEICHLCSSPYNSHGEWDTGSETRGVRPLLVTATRLLPVHRALNTVHSTGRRSHQQPHWPPLTPLTGRGKLH